MGMTPVIMAKSPNMLHEEQNSIDTEPDKRSCNFTCPFIAL
jgi:hypothetical protein